MNNGGMTLKQALLSAQGHMPTTTKHFTIPVSLAAGSSGGGPRTGGGSGARSRSPPGGRPSEGFDVPSHSAHHARGPRGKGSKGGGSKSGNAKSKPRNNPSGDDRREKKGKTRKLRMVATSATSFSEAIAQATAAGCTRACGATVHIR